MRSARFRLDGVVGLAAAKGNGRWGRTSTAPVASGQPWSRRTSCAGCAGDCGGAGPLEMTSPAMETDVLVVGAGPAGLTAATALSTYENGTGGLVGARAALSW
jgi:NADPH-dependent 2,4-dienoyl-CoA reductase/sulfur reductase-like enzyme